MAKRTRKIPRAPLARILQNAGAKRVSAEATEAFAQVLEDIASNLAEKSIKFAKHSGRRTVKDEDVRLASK